jgi:predicted 3-demethylubiquinone-9 3-methyltransferase (glyoxalase superfamily)
METIKQRIAPHLWYDKEAKEAAEFYASVFPDSTLMIRVDGSPSFGMMW